MQCRVPCSVCLIHICYRLQQTLQSGYISLRYSFMQCAPGLHAFLFLLGFHLLLLFVIIRTPQRCFLFTPFLFFNFGIRLIGIDKLRGGYPMSPGRGATDNGKVLHSEPWWARDYIVLASFSFRDADAVEEVEAAHEVGRCEGATHEGAVGLNKVGSLLRGFLEELDAEAGEAGAAHA